MNPAYRKSVKLGILAVLAACLPVFAETSSEDLKMIMGKTIVLDYPADIRQISTSDPQIVDPVAVTTREILLHGKSAGNATVVVWAKSGQRTFYNVSVEANMEPMRKLLKESFPNEDIRLQTARDSVVLVGKVSSKDVSDRVASVVATMTKNATNNLQVIPGPVDKQIILRVKFAQMDRTIGKQFAINLVSTGAGNTIGRVTTGQAPSANPSNIGGGQTSFSLSDALNIFAFRPDLNLATFIKALQNQDVLQILAEPNLVTTNGKEASFLVGGEVPIPVLQGSGNGGSVTIQFREFGIRLTFLPVLTPNNTIKMLVKPEVSAIDVANGVSIAGFTVPGLSTRKMETNIELAPGQSFVIAGLIDDRVSESIQKIPGLANIPILGQLFKSRIERKQKTELVVMVTPEIVQPFSAADQKVIPEMPKEFLEPKKFDKPFKQEPTKPHASAQPAKK
jgi:pilus assembly protein CpaC